jgi:hypothetical protein
MSQINPVHALTISFRFISISSIHPSIPLLIFGVRNKVLCGVPIGAACSPQPLLVRILNDILRSWTLQR